MRWILPFGRQGNIKIILNGRWTRFCLPHSLKFISKNIKHFYSKFKRLPHFITNCLWIVRVSMNLITFFFEYIAHISSNIVAEIFVLCSIVRNLHASYDYVIDANTRSSILFHNFIISMCGCSSICNENIMICLRHFYYKHCDIFFHMKKANEKCSFFLQQNWIINFWCT